METEPTTQEISRLRRCINDLASILALPASKSLVKLTDSIPETIRLIIDSTPALIHTALPGGHIDFFNQTWLRYVGLRLENQGWN